MSKAAIFARAAFLAVFAVNVCCALGFVFAPESYAGAYQLEGVSGNVAVQGVGVAFLMWNATYPPFIWNPRSHMTFGAVILVQQAIGCIGETCILFSLPAGYGVLAASIVRFICFDVAGLALMASAYTWLYKDVANQGRNT